MVREAAAKVITLGIVLAALVLQCLRIPADAVGLFIGAPWWHRLSYVFFHAGWIHCLMNCWCLLCVIFLYRITAPMMAGAFIVAASFPCSFFFPSGIMPATVGLSGVIYALLGRYSFGVQRIWFYQLWWAFFIGLGFLFTSCNAWLHLYCYVCGLVLALLNKPYRHGKEE